MHLRDLRHSCATLLLAQGVHPKLVQETLGRSTYLLTMDTYSHMIPQLRNEVADQMDEILSSSHQCFHQNDVDQVAVIVKLLSWCPEGDLNPHGLAACGF